MSNIKYTKDFKLKVVKYYLKTHSGYTNTSKEFRIPRTCIVKWVRMYKKYGIQGLLNTRKKYDGNFKRNVVEYMNKHHLSFTETAILFNIGCHSSVSKWYSMYCEKGAQAFLKKDCEKSKTMKSKPSKKDFSKKEQKDLIAENQRLKMENEYLKKLNALVQERIKQENMKK